MQTVYRINTIAGYKPWRSGGPYYITDPEIFKLIAEMEDTSEFYRVPAPGAIQDEDHPDYDEDDTLAEWLYSNHTTVNPEFPFILAGEVTFYTE
ncbi:MAG: hypothetical protein EOO38_02755 [Cytophagaceae bacterium]|nr:MAG: hypothetical protein EOO38_02755 [Cytophagaceae bacterium]